MAEERQQPASPRRLADALAAGVRPISRDAISVAAVGVTCWVVAATCSNWGAQWNAWLLASIDAVAVRAPFESTMRVQQLQARTLLEPLFAVLLATLLAVLLAWVAQGALRFRSRSAARRVVAQPMSAVRTFWLSVKALVIVLGFVSVAHHALRAVVSTPTADIAYTQRVIDGIAQLLLSRVGVALGLFAIADVIMERWLWRRSLRMTRDELKRELRETEGDPTMRDERRSRQQRIALEP